MNRIEALIAASFTLTLVAGAGHAAQAADPKAAPPVQLAAGATGQSATGQSATGQSATGQSQATFQSKPMMVTEQTAPPAQIRALAAGDNKLVTNGPIPDTAANRARYGKPLSHTARQSAPDGN